jgi:hypothetical protein
MTPITFNKKSWHCWIAENPGGLCVSPYEDWATDICTYTKCFLRGSVLLLFLFALACGIAFCLIHMLIGIALSLWYGMFIFSELGFMTLFMTTIVAFVASIFFSAKGIQKWRDDQNLRHQNDPPKPDGFLKAAYKSFKGKYCVPVKLN